jgi:hypothetical protein
MFVQLFRLEKKQKIEKKKKGKKAIFSLKDFMIDF